MSDRVFEVEDLNADTVTIGTTGGSHKVPAGTAGTTPPGRADTGGDGSKVYLTPREQPSGRPVVENRNPIINADGQQVEKNEIPKNNNIPPVIVAKDPIPDEALFDNPPPKQGLSASDAVVYPSAPQENKEENPRVFTTDPQDTNQTPSVHTNAQQTPPPEPNSGVNKAVANASRTVANASEEELTECTNRVEKETGAKTGEDPIAAEVRRHRVLELLRRGGNG